MGKVLGSSFGTPLYMRYALMWGEGEVDHLPELRKFAEKMPLAHHLAFKAIIDDTLILIDATPDLPLKKYV